MKGIDDRSFVLLEDQLAMLELSGLDKLESDKVDGQLAQLSEIRELLDHLAEHKLLVLFVQLPQFSEIRLTHADGLDFALADGPGLHIRCDSSITLIEAEDAPCPVDVARDRYSFAVDVPLSLDNPFKDDENFAVWEDHLVHGIVSHPHPWKEVL